MGVSLVCYFCFNFPTRYTIIKMVLWMMDYIVVWFNAFYYFKELPINLYNLILNFVSISLFFKKNLKVTFYFKKNCLQEKNQITVHHLPLNRPRKYSKLFQRAGIWCALTFVWFVITVIIYMYYVFFYLFVIAFLHIRRWLHWFNAVLRPIKIISLTSLNASKRRKKKIHGG